MRYESRRPPQAERTFTSPAVENLLERVGSDISDPELRWLFENCLPNTLDTTVERAMANGQDTFVVTGDIPAMWLRDSTAQVWPYLGLMHEDEQLQQMVAGLVRRHTRMVLLDPYANAFNLDEAGLRHGQEYTEVKPGVWERKWELDSLCYVIRLAHGYWRATGDAGVLDDTWREAMHTIVRTMKQQQRLDGPGPYRFAHPEITRDGWGAETESVGLIHSVFRPSDDAAQYPFVIPANILAVVSLRQLAEILNEVFHDEPFVAECRQLADQVWRAVEDYGIVTHPHFGAIYAYEVDGRGNANLMDDANAPSLLSLPYFDPAFHHDDIYHHTRQFVLSELNPYYHAGPVLAGIGSSHTGPGSVWPMSVIMRALTSRSEAEMRQCLAWLKAAYAGSGFMRESVDPGDATKFTREWFAWANSLFGELILWLHKEHPAALQPK